MFDRPRSPQALALIGLAAAACAVTLAACGGGGEGTTESTAAAGTATNGAAPKASGRQPGNGATAQPSGGSESSAGPGAPGGESGIQAFGEEVAGSDLRQADEAVAALFRAVKSGDWSHVCGQYLSGQNVKALKKIAAQGSPHKKGAPCPEAISSLNSTGEKPIAPEHGVGAMRIEGNRGFAVYRGTDGKAYAISMTREDGRWKLNALRPTPLEP